VTRYPEPELMEDDAQTDAYAAADLSELQQAMVTYFAERCGGLSSGGRLLDLGCGAADMTIRFASAWRGITALGVDGSDSFLRRAHAAIRAAGVEDRVRVERRYLPDTALETREFDAVIANSVLHHLADPAALWRTAVRCAKPGAPVMVMDLRRPATLADAQSLVDRHAADAAPVLRQDFFNSLRAAYRADEIRLQLDGAGLRDFQIEELGDLHVRVWGVAP
jgi:cyclopropane fatty-acyl-phospholipid synthase-like methyltransferase